VDLKFSTQTDVWSYGCLCVELWSAGEVRQRWALWSYVGRLTVSEPEWFLLQMPFGKMDDKEVIQHLVYAAKNALPPDEPVLPSPPRCPDRMSMCAGKAMVRDEAHRVIWGCLPYV
jgi:hypothetical protein